MIKAAIFDLDGTLADTMDDLLTAMNGMLVELGFATRTRDELTRFINRGARYFVGRSLPDGSVPDFNDPLVDRALVIYGRHYAKCCLDKTAPFKGVPEAIEEIKAAGIKVGVLSNKQDAFVKETVEKLYPGVFDTIRGQLDLPEKPDPAPALAVAAELGAAPCECAFIGDSDIDMKTGVNSGMLPVGVTWGYRSEECLTEAGAKIIVRSPEELCGALGAAVTE
ncbi:MAG: HAD-IA family hydrolase [Clostridia bacterium]|nr:HAD-IA family hydrolase [Clostridia bacterium]